MWIWTRTPTEEEVPRERDTLIVSRVLLDETEEEHHIETDSGAVIRHHFIGGPGDGNIIAWYLPHKPPPVEQIKHDQKQLGLR